MTSQPTPKPSAKKLPVDPIVRLGDVRDLTTSDDEGPSTDDGPLNGRNRKFDSI